MFTNLFRVVVQESPGLYRYVVGCGDSLTRAEAEYKISRLRLRPEYRDADLKPSRVRVPKSYMNDLWRTAA
jgi:hypothetical protein